MLSWTLKTREVKINACLSLGDQYVYTSLCAP